MNEVAELSRNSSSMNLRDQARTSLSTHHHQSLSWSLSAWAAAASTCRRITTTSAFHSAPSSRGHPGGIINLFTRGDHLAGRPSNGVPEEEEIARVQRLRRQEDEAFARSRDLTQMDLGLDGPWSGGAGLAITQDSTRTWPNWAPLPSCIHEAVWDFPPV
jgi:hypothetical protein